MADSDAIEFGSPNRAMEDLVEESGSAPMVNDEIPVIPVSKKAPFDPQAVTHALKDEEVDGGVTPSKSASESIFGPDGLTATGGIIPPQPNMEKASLVDKFEVTGFTVEVPTTPGNVASVRVRDYFDSMAEVMASLEGSRYLMPIKPSGFKVTKITLGAPIVCRNERQLWEYVDGKWRKC